MVNNCKNCTALLATGCTSMGCACNAIFCSILSINHIQPRTHVPTKKIAYTIYILYYYYICTTIYSLNGVFAFLAVQFLCNFLQFFATSAI